MAKRRNNQALIVGALALGLLFLLPKKAASYSVPLSELDKAFRDAELTNMLPPGILKSMARIESGLRPEVISGQVKGQAGEVGIMQITPRWHPEVDPYDPIASIWYAAQWLRELYAQFGGWREAVAAYNWGPTNLRNLGLDAAPPITQAYIKKVAREVGI